MPDEIRIGLYPGTFDPITLGHMDIIERCAKLVDHLIIGISTNPSKTPLFSVEERINMVKRETDHIKEKQGTKVEVQSFDCLLMKFAEQINAAAIFRGLRAVSDFEYEFQMTAMNYQLNPDIETVFLMADPSLQAIASKLVKEIALYDGDIAKFVTPAVRKDVLLKMANSI